MVVTALPGGWEVVNVGSVLSRPQLLKTGILDVWAAKMVGGFSSFQVVMSRAADHLCQDLEPCPYEKPPSISGFCLYCSAAFGTLDPHNPTLLLCDSVGM